MPSPAQPSKLGSDFEGRGFVSGHGFSRAERENSNRAEIILGLKPPIGMKLIGSARKIQNQANSRLRQSVAERVRNEDYPASLELRKVYQVLAGQQAAKHCQMRVIDESGEDYLYPREYFVPIKLPQAAEKAVLRAV